MNPVMPPLERQPAHKGQSAAICAMTFGVAATLAYYAMVDAPLAHRSACLVAAAASLLMAGWSGSRAVA